MLLRRKGAFMNFTNALRYSLFAFSCISAVPASAQSAVAQEQVSVSDVATTPLSDLNLKKDEIPAILVTSRELPYSLAGMTRCSAITNEIAQLNAVLGDDIDISRDDGGSNISVGSAAQSVIRSLIPFGGLIRELSGAGGHERKWNEAIYAGSVRRAFLKGIGQQRGCKYPARSASAADAKKLWAQRNAAVSSDKVGKPEEGKAKAKPQKDKKPKASKDAKGNSVKFESKPVVQSIN
jgi:hypothetical protein